MLAERYHIHSPFCLNSLATALPCSQYLGMSASVLSPFAPFADLTQRGGLVWFHVCRFAPETTSPNHNKHDRNRTKRSKINEADRYPPAHNGRVADSSPAGPIHSLLARVCDHHTRNASLCHAMVTRIVDSEDNQSLLRATPEYPTKRNDTTYPPVRAIA